MNRPGVVSRPFAGWSHQTCGWLRLRPSRRLYGSSWPPWRPPAPWPPSRGRLTSCRRPACPRPTSPTSWRRRPWPPRSTCGSHPPWCPPGSARTRRSGPGGPPVGQQLGGPFRRDAVDRVALAQRGVGDAVGDIGAEAAVLELDRRSPDRVWPQLPERPGRRPPAPPGLGLGEEGHGFVQADGEELIFGLQRPGIGSFFEIRAVAAVAGHDVLAGRRVGADHPGQREHPQRILERQGGRVHARQEGGRPAGLPVDASASPPGRSGPNRPASTTTTGRPELGSNPRPGRSNRLSRSSSGPGQGQLVRSEVLRDRRSLASPRCTYGP